MVWGDKKRVRKDHHSIWQGTFLLLCAAFLCTPFNMHGSFPAQRAFVGGGPSSQSKFNVKVSTPRGWLFTRSGLSDLDLGGGGTLSPMQMVQRLQENT